MSEECDKYFVEIEGGHKFEVCRTHKKSCELERQFAEKDAEIAGLRKALEEIDNLQWTPVIDGRGPSDCTPNEKGLLEYVGRANSIAREALSLHGPAASEAK